MTANVRLVAGPAGPVVAGLHGSGALAFRPTRWGVWMVGTEAHPIGGDRVLARVALGPGCSAIVRSTSATLARRGAGPSVVSIAARVAAGASLEWRPEPGIAAFGADHTSEARVRLAAGARVVWHDEWVLGRASEGPGSWRSRLQIVYDCEPLLVSDLSTGPAAGCWHSAAVLGGAKAVSSVVVVDVGGEFNPARAECGSALGVRLPLAGPGIQICAWGDDLADCREVVDDLLTGVSPN